MNYNSIALCGGGGKGAYQIGVMKALAETNNLNNINYISGTSVGALNAVLFAKGDVELAESVWLKFVNPEKMLKNIDLPRYELSRAGLKEMINYIGIRRLRSSPCVYVYAHNIKTKQPEVFLLNDKSESDIMTLLLASASLPIIYTPVEYHGEKYIDGGYTAIGNHPIKVLADKGRKNIILVPLDYRFNPHAVSNCYFGQKISIYNSFPGVEFKIIKPSLDIGKTIDGTVDFKPESIRERMVLGYNDAIKLLGSKKGDCEMDINVNFEISKLASEVIKNSKDFEEFVSLCSFKNMNIKTKVIRAEICFDKIFERDGWTIEWHKITPRKRHYRIIDPQDYRRAWTLDPAEIIKNLILYREAKKARK